MKVQALRDDVGVALRVDPGRAGARAKIAGFLVFDGGLPLRGKGIYRDEDGDFLRGVERQGRQFRAFLPWGAMEYRGEGLRTLRVVLVEHPGGPAVEVAEVPLLLPERPSFVHARTFSPLIGLAMAVAYADGTLDDVEVRVLRRTLVDAFGFGPDDDHYLKTMMRMRPEDDLRPLLHGVRDRLPWLDPAAVVALCGQIATEPGRPHPAQIALLEDIARRLQAGDEVVAEVKEAATGGSSRAEDLALLGLEDGATPTEIKRAWRQQLKHYHPDRFEQHPDEFKVLAAEKTRELNAAWDRLKAGGDGGGAERGRRRDPAPTRRHGPFAWQLPATRRWEDLTATRAPSRPAARDPEDTDWNANEWEDHGWEDDGTPVAVADDEGGRAAMAGLGAIVGFFLGLPAGGIGALPAAIIGGIVGWWWKELGCLALVLLLVLLLVAGVVIMMLGAMLGGL